MHRNNLEKVAELFDVSLSWLITGEGTRSAVGPAEIGDGKFVPILTGPEIMAKKKRPAKPKYIFLPNLQEENAIGYSTTSDLHPGVVESTLILVPSDLENRFENGKWYLLAIDRLLIIRWVEKVIFGKQKGSFKLTDWNGDTDFMDPKGVAVWRVVWKVEKLG